MPHSLNAEIEELLRELLMTSSATKVRLGPKPIPQTKLGPQHTELGIQRTGIGNQRANLGIQHVELGKGAMLSATFPAEGVGKTLQSHQELLEHSSRAIRACLIRHGGDTFPFLVLPNDKPEPRHLILARIQQFLSALVDTSSLYQMVLLYHGKTIASAVPLEELDSERLALLIRQLENAAKKTQGSDHGELVRSDMYACTFWYGAALIGFSNSDYSIDFVRHRCKLVARELAHLLSLLIDTDPDSPAAIAPIPDS